LLDSWLAKTFYPAAAAGEKSWLSRLSQILSAAAAASQSKKSAAAAKDGGLGV